MNFQPTMLGHVVYFEDDEERPGMITDESEDQIYIESHFFTGWMLKTTYWESLGVPD